MGILPLQLFILIAFYTYGTTIDYSRNSHELCSQNSLVVYVLPCSLYHSLCISVSLPFSSLHIYISDIPVVLSLSYSLPDYLVLMCLLKVMSPPLYFVVHQGSIPSSCTWLSKIASS